MILVDFIKKRRDFDLQEGMAASLKESSRGSLRRHVSLLLMAECAEPRTRGLLTAAVGNVSSVEVDGITLITLLPENLQGSPTSSGLDPSLHEWKTTGGRDL